PLMPCYSRMKIKRLSAIRVGRPGWVPGLCSWASPDSHPHGHPGRRSGPERCSCRKRPERRPGHTPGSGEPPDAPMEKRRHLLPQRRRPPRVVRNLPEASTTPRKTTVKLELIRGEFAEGSVQLK